MFETLTRPRRGHVLRRVVLVVLVLMAALVGASWYKLHRILNDATELERVIGWALADAPLSIRVARAHTIPEDAWLPTRWRVVIADLRVAHADPSRPAIQVARLESDLPDLAALVLDREVRLRWLRVHGLRIHLPRQPPPEPWVEEDTPISRILADKVELYGGFFRAEPDDPLPQVEMADMEAELTGVAYAPGARLLSGSGHGRMSTLVAGTVPLHDLVLPELNCVDSTLVGAGTFRYAGRPGRVTGEIRDFHRRGAGTFELTLPDASFERVIEGATDARSPISGTLDAAFVLHTGGELPRGGAFMEGTATLSGGRLHLGDEVKPGTLRLLRLAPWVELADHTVVLGDLRGRLRLDRGRVTVHRLLYESTGGDRRIEAWGHFGRGGLDATVRLVPRRDPDGRAGLGVVISGSRDALDLRLAREEELIRE